MADQSVPLSYRALLANKRISSVLAAVTVGRLAAGMVPFGMIAVFTGQRELGLAGASFTAFLLGAAISGPYKGALVDRYGASRLLFPLALGFAAAASGAAALATAGHELLHPIAVVLTAGAAVLAPPNSAILRTVWTEIANNDEQNTRLHSLDSVVEEATFVIAPLLTSGIWLAVGAHWAVVTGGLCALIGTLWFKQLIWHLGADNVIHGSRDSQGRAGGKTPIIVVLVSRNGIAVLAPMAALGLAMGALSVGYPAWSLERFHEEFSGVLMALDSTGGIVAGLIYGRIASRHTRLWRRYFWATSILAGGVVVVAISTNIPLVVLGSLLAGAALTPMYIIAFVLVGSAFPKDRQTTVNASVGSIFNLGSGVAASAAGMALGMWPLAVVLLVVAAVTIALGATALLGRVASSAAPDAPTTKRDPSQSTSHVTE